MRAWMRREVSDIRKLAARDLMIIVATKPPQLLDRPSLAEAVAGPFTCSGFRFHEVCVRRHGKVAWFTAKADLELRIGGRDLLDRFWICDLWKRGTVRRSWKLVERSLSRMDDDEQLSASIRQLQLWH